MAAAPHPDEMEDQVEHHSNYSAEGQVTLSPKAECALYKRREGSPSLDSGIFCPSNSRCSPEPAGDSISEKNDSDVPPRYSEFLLGAIYNKDFVTSIKSSDQEGDIKKEKVENKAEKVVKDEEYDRVLSEEEDIFFTFPSVEDGAIDANLAHEISVLSSLMGANGDLIKKEISVAITEETILNANFNPNLYVEYVTQKNPNYEPSSLEEILNPNPDPDSFIKLPSITEGNGSEVDSEIVNVSDNASGSDICSDSCTDTGSDEGSYVPSCDEDTLIKDINSRLHTIPDPKQKEEEKILSKKLNYLLKKDLKSSDKGKTSQDQGQISSYQNFNPFIKENASNPITPFNDGISEIGACWLQNTSQQITSWVNEVMQTYDSPEFMASKQNTETDDGIVNIPEVNTPSSNDLNEEPEAADQEIESDISQLNLNR